MRGVGRAHAGALALFVPWQRRGDLVRILSARWPEGRPDAPALEALADELLRRRWISLAAVVTTAVAEEAPLEAALLLRRLEVMPPLEELHVRLPRSAPALASALKGALSRRLPAARIVVRKGTFAAAFAVADAVLGAILDDYDDRHGRGSRALSVRLAENIGWDHLAADTPREAWKLNLWYAPTWSELEAPSEKPTRPVQLRLPLVD